MGQLDGKVVVISGAARGQGRAHAIRFAEEGADVIALDICRDVETVPYEGATPEELEETVAAVENLDRRIIASQVDVRDHDAVREAVDRGVSQLGRIDFAVANAGIATYVTADQLDDRTWQTMLDVNLTGAWNICSAVFPTLMEQGDGGSIVITSSTASYVGFAHAAHYSAAKAGLVGLMQSLAVELGPHMIRVNTIHPTAVYTKMAVNQSTYDIFAPGQGLSIDSPEDEVTVAEAYKTLNAMPVAWIDPVDLANAAVYLCSDSGRYVTGTQLRVDAGCGTK